MNYSVLPDEVLGGIEADTKAYYWQCRQSGISSEKAYAMAMNHRQELISMANSKWQVDEAKANTPSDTKQMLTALGIAGAGGLGYALGPKLVGKGGAGGVLSQGYDAVKGILGGNPKGAVTPSMPETVIDQAVAASPKEPWGLDMVNGLGGPDPLPGWESASGLGPEGYPMLDAGTGAFSTAQESAWVPEQFATEWGLDSAAPAAEAPGMMGGYVLPGAAAAIGGYQGIKGVEEGNPLQAGLGGVGLGYGGTALLSNLGVIGAVNPVAAALIGAAVLGGASLFGGHKTTKEIQAERRGSLLDKGVTGYEDFMSKTMAGDEDYQSKYGDKITNSAGFRSDLAPDFVGIDPASGRWMNNAFAQSGDISTLRPEDVWGSEGVFSTFGNDWLGTYTEDQRRQIAQQLLNEGLFQGDKGDMIIHSSDQDRARQIAAGVVNGTAPQQPEVAGGAPLDTSSSVSQSIPKIANLDATSSLIAGMSGDGGQSPLIAALMASPETGQGFQPYSSGAWGGVDYSQIVPYLKGFTGVMR